MKSLFGLLPALLGCGLSCATVLEVGTIEQPINLGRNSDPDRIPLAPVVVESNHGYGIHEVISMARPCTHGALVLAKGLELNMNLASVFGIQVMPDDPTQVPHDPVTIHVKDWPAPSYSPYRKDQVLAATLHCLLRSVHATPKRPLKVVIMAENEEDAKNLGGFAGDYLTAEADEQGGPTPVPGTRLETDRLGVTYMTFADGRKRKADSPPRLAPVLTPMRLDEDGEVVSYEALPVWPGDNWTGDRHTIISQPVTLFYDRFDPSSSYGPDINAVSKFRLLAGCHWTETVDGNRLSLEVREPAPEMTEGMAGALAALCQTAILSSQPTAKNPLTIEISVSADSLGELKPFTTSEAWTLAPAREESKTRRELSCQFVWDATGDILQKGSLPLVRPVRNPDRPWTISFFDGKDPTARTADNLPPSGD